MADGDFPARLIERADGGSAVGVVDSPGSTHGGQDGVGTFEGPPGVDEARKRSFLTLVNWHRPQIELLCGQVTDRRDDAKDAVVQALTTVWHRLDEGLAAHAPEVWLYRVVRDAAVDVAQHAPVDVAAPPPLAGGDGAAVRAVMLRLRPEYRSAFILADGIGFDESQVAQIEGVPAATAAERVNGARRAIAWGLGGAQGEVALGPDGRFDLGWLALGAAAGTPTFNLERARAALYAVSKPGLWDRTWEFYLSQAMTSAPQAAAPKAALLAPVMYAAPTGPEPTNGRKRRGVVWLALAGAAALLAGGVWLTSRNSNSGTVGDAASFASESDDGSGEGTEGVDNSGLSGKSASGKTTTTKKPAKSKATTTTQADDVGPDDSAFADNDADADADADADSGNALLPGSSSRGSTTTTLDEGDFDFGDDFAFDDSATNDDFEIIPDDEPDTTPTSPSGTTRTTVRSGSTATTSASGSAGVTGPPLKLVASASSSAINVKWSGAASSATGVVVSWQCCNPVSEGTSEVLAIGGSHTITGLRPATEYRVTFLVLGAASEANTMTIAIRTTTAPPTTVPPTTQAPATTTTLAIPPSTTTTAFDVGEGAPGPGTPSAGGD